MSREVSPPPVLAFRRFDRTSITFHVLFTDLHNMVCRVCCAQNSCPTSATGQVLPPESCTPACAVAMHSFESTCGETFDNIIRDGFNRDFHAFEQGCLSEANPLTFLDAIMVRAPSSLVVPLPSRQPLRQFSRICGPKCIESHLLAALFLSADRRLF